jgi:hypothetical protein
MAKRLGPQRIFEVSTEEPEKNRKRVNSPKFKEVMDSFKQEAGYVHPRSGRG